MSSSVRAVVEPYHHALGGTSVIFLQSSFTGLPLINQALAVEHPLGGGTFFVTVKTLLKVLEEIPASAVIQALAAQNAPPVHTPPTSPPDHQTPVPGSPPIVTCRVEMDLNNPGFGGITNFRVFGSGFAPQEGVEIIELLGGSPTLFATTNADALGSYQVTVGVFDSPFRSVMHIVHAQGVSSGRTSNNAGFTN